MFTVNLNKYICTKKACPAVVGRVIPYRDENHLTVTFTKTLSPTSTRRSGPSPKAPVLIRGAPLSLPGRTASRKSRTHVVVGTVVSVILRLPRRRRHRRDGSGRALRERSPSAPVVEAPHSRACIGAGAMDRTRVCPSVRKLRTSPEDAFNDISIGYTRCLMWPPYPDQTLSCVLGDRTRPKERIALFGNSHAGHWTEALTRIAKRHHWELDTFIMGACFSTLEPAPDSCSEIRGKVKASILGGRYDLVILATLDTDPLSSTATYAPTLQDLTSAGSNVLVIRDTPAPGTKVPLTTDCVEAHPKHWKKCAGRSADWVTDDRLTDAAKEAADHRIRTVNLNRFFCRAGICPAVIGGEIPYRDTSHLTVTFTKSLIPYLGPAVEAAMPASRH